MEPARPNGCSIAFTVDVEDWYQGIPMDAQWKANAERRLDMSGNRLLDLMGEHGVRGTFYVLGPVAKDHPELVRRMAREGHEIGSHGWSHDLLYDMARERFREETLRSVEVITEVSGVRPTSYRAAYFSITKKNLWALDILAELGFESDSSIFPVHNWRYGIPDYGQAPRRVETPSGAIREFPLSVNRLLGQNVPASGGAYFRLYPYSFTRYNLNRRLRRREPTVFYVHPWELDPDHPRVRFDRRAMVTHYANLRSTEPKLRRLFSDFSFATLGSVMTRCLP